MAEGRQRNRRLAKRPKDTKDRSYRHLYRRADGTIYVGRRVKRSGKYVWLRRENARTTDWEEARAFRDTQFAENRAAWFPEEFPPPPVEVEAAAPPPPRTFRDEAEAYLKSGMGGRKLTTRADRESILREDGPLLPTFGDLSLEAIGVAALRRWWTDEIEEHTDAEGNLRPRSVQTGRNYLNTMSRVFQYAEQEGRYHGENPTRALRRRLREEKAGTAEARAATQSKAHPIEEPLELHRLVEAAREEGPEAHALVLLLLDAGLRLGEAFGLVWGNVAASHVGVAESNSRGAGRVIPKTGLARRVHLSRRTREALEAERRRQFKPRPGAPVFGFDASNFRRRAWRRICERAGIENRPIKDLRDTYASWLLSLGVQLGYVSQQLGHADVAVTARHYALWCGGEQYQAPIQLEPGEVPADLLEWVAAEAAAKPETESVEGRAGPTVQAVSAPGPGGESAEARGV